MNRLERLTAIMSMIQSKPFTRLKEIQERFNISERTTYRDIRALEESGIPIIFEKNKGYGVMEGHYLPPLAFTLDEAKSFIFAEQLARRYFDRDTFKLFDQALEKVKNKLNSAQLLEIDELQSRVGIYIGDHPAAKYLQQVEQACYNKNLIHIKYEDFSGNRTERVVEPIAITFYGQAWHLVAYCRLREDYRDFSMQRILELDVRTELMTTKRLTLTEYIKKIENSSNH